ncbi:hypothetical protein L6452_05245 [Arctium lappa]|uniref:Uncharacterized protein n=1 Tax=Arctium lappa TaxID=4217 RepID=A0ACB9EFV4_ARCLA|nr:hypothetical protein L6452_05245 [Arctium lappa]
MWRFKYGFEVEWIPEIRSRLASFVGSDDKPNGVQNLAEEEAEATGGLMRLFRLLLMLVMGWKQVEREVVIDLVLHGGGGGTTDFEFNGGFGTDG